MPIQLPEYEHEFFEESPLEEVVCQLLFNPILTISSAQPAQFQELIRKQFPVLEKTQGVQLAISKDHHPITLPTEPVWQFKTADKNWTVSLTSTFVALKTTAYRDFEDFLSRLLPVVRAFESVYEPPFYVRVGLRYVNRIVIKREQDQRVEWEEFLNDRLVGVFADPVLQDGIAEMNHHLVLQADSGKIGWRYSRDVGQADGEAAERFTLDFDHHNVGEIECTSVREHLVAFNDTIYRLFRWCLSEKGYRELNPQVKEEQEA